ncbi:MAG TPA: oligosaccharide flippase family protein [bacterium]|nr:oligosaccharide flippase family protein [bacterium]
MGGMLATRFIAVLVVPIITRILPPGEYGLYLLGTRLLEILALVFHFGFISSIVRFIAIYEGGGKRSYSNAAIMGTSIVSLISISLFGLIILIKPDLISVVIFGRPEFSRLAQIIILALPLAVISQILLQATVARGTVVYKILSELSVNPVKLVIIFLLCHYMNLGAAGAVIAMFMYCLARFLIAAIGVNRLFPGMKYAEIKYFEFKRVMSYSFPLLLSEVSVFAVYQISFLLGARWLSDADLGLYGVASTMIYMGTMGYGSVTTMLRPTIADLFNRNEKERLKEIYITTVRWAYHASIMPLVFLSVKSNSVLQVFGDKYVGGSGIVAILAAGLGLNIIAGYGSSLLEMTNRPWLPTINNFIMTGVTVFLCITLVPRYGMLGMAISSSVALFGIGVLAGIEAWIVHGLHPFSIKAVKPLAAVVFSSPVLLLHFDPWWLDVLATGFIYLTGYVLINLVMGIEPDDRMVLKAVCSKLNFMKKH